MPAGTGKPPFASTLSKLSLNKTNARPASGFAPPASAATNPLAKDKTALPSAAAAVGIARGGGTIRYAVHVLVVISAAVRRSAVAATGVPGGNNSIYLERTRPDNRSIGGESED